MSEGVFYEELITKNYQGRGKIEFLRGFDIENINVKGKISIYSDSKFFKLNMSGEIEAESLYGEILHIKGLIKGKNIKANNISISGSFDLNGIEGENVLLKGGNSHINLINGTNLEIYGTSREEKENFDIDTLFKNSFFQKISEFIDLTNIRKNINTENSYIHVDRIKGKKLILQNVIANYVEGEEIKILSGCQIKEINKKK